MECAPRWLTLQEAGELRVAVGDVSSPPLLTERADHVAQTEQAGVDLDA